MKVYTVEQFKILQFIQKNSDMEFIRLELVSKTEIKVTDQENESLTFKYENGKVIW